MNKEDNNDWKRKPIPMPEPSDVLAYVETIAHKYIKPINDLNEVNIEPHEENVSFEELLEMVSKDTLGFSPLSNVTKTFYRRYYWKKLTHYFTYDEYIKNQEIQKLLQELELDKEKFWYLILFAYDYSESLCINGIDVSPSAYEQLKTLIEKITQCGIKFDLNNGCTLGKDIKLKVHIEGETKPFIIDNPNAICLLIASCQSELKSKPWHEQYIMNHREPLKKSKSLKDSPHIYYFAKIFLNFFDTVESIRNKRKEGAKHSLKEMDIASRLVYLTKLSTNKNLLDIECQTLKAYIKQYKNLDLAYKESNIYDNFII